MINAIKISPLLLCLFFSTVFIGPPAVSARPSFVNKAGIKFIKINSGSFTMGSPSSELGRKWDEKQHKVIITKSFYISETEITQLQWFKIMKFNPSQFKECGGECPVETVSWNDCQAFIKRLNRIERTRKYRLPTEAEWEYTCRAGSSTAFASGNITVSQCEIDPNLDKIGWYCGNTGVRKPVIYGMSPKPVGRKKPNAWGLYDMHGNVYEWCLDSCKTRSMMRTGVVTDTYNEKKSSNPLSTKGTNKLIRGGSWNTSTRYSRSANRGSYKPLAKRNFIGLRLVKEQ